MKHHIFVTTFQSFGDRSESNRIFSLFDGLRRQNRRHVVPPIGPTQDNPEFLTNLEFGFLLIVAILLLITSGCSVKLPSQQTGGLEAVVSCQQQTGEGEGGRGCLILPEEQIGQAEADDSTDPASAEAVAEEFIPSLTDMSDMSEMQAVFNANPDRPRLILLLSPT